MLGGGVGVGAGVGVDGGAMASAGISLVCFQGFIRISRNACGVIFGKIFKDGNKTVRANDSVSHVLVRHFCQRISYRRFKYRTGYHLGERFTLLFVGLELGFRSHFSFFLVRRISELRVAPMRLLAKDESEGMA